MSHEANRTSTINLTQSFGDEQSKTASINLPYYKQGDDLAEHLAETDSVAKAIEDHAERLTFARDQLLAIKDIVAGQPVTIDAGAHIIWLTGPATVVDKLVALGLAELDE
jgi:hypothetical protein